MGVGCILGCHVWMTVFSSVVSPHKMLEQIIVGVAEFSRVECTDRICKLCGEAFLLGKTVKLITSLLNDSMVFLGSSQENNL